MISMPTIPTPNPELLAKNLATVAPLLPHSLWQWFATIASIPHSSYHEETLAAFIVDWAISQKLDVRRDHAGNIIIKKRASLGMEACATIALQAHLDMVPQANDDVVHDFGADALTLRRDKNWLLATHTTLGADNGIGMASCLALLGSDDVTHPALEVLLTMTEETGMVGVKALKPQTLEAGIMINTDTEEIGEIYVGCAGRVDADVRLPIRYTNNTHAHARMLTIAGLKGGHSGIDIDKPLGNAIKILGQILLPLTGRVCLCDLAGGSLRNAIPRQAQVLLCFDDTAILADIEMAIATIKEQYASEQGLTITLQDAVPPTMTLDLDTSTQAIALINALPSGVVTYSDRLADTVETSLSFGVLGLDDECLHASLLVRSLTTQGKEVVCHKIASIGHFVQASVAFDGDYVGWDYDPTSPITALCAKVYGEILGKEPAIKVIHAGLECGLIKQSHPEMDIVSIGPTIKGAHSPDEKVDVTSVLVYWQVLTGILANAPQHQRTS